MLNMHPFFASSTQMVAALSLLHNVLAQNLAIVNPCPQSSGIAPITVTSQYQSISTCYPTAICVANGNCAQTYSYSTFAFVSTIIPCAYDGSTHSSCTVTSTQDSVVVSTATTTVTSVLSVAAAQAQRGGPHATPTFTTIYDVRDTKVEAEYDQLGPLAIPNYPGSGLCDSCQNADGSIEQEVEVTDCRTIFNGKQCSQRKETWISVPSQSLAAPTTATLVTRYSAPSAGTYTFVFDREAPVKTIPIPQRTVRVMIHGRPTHQIQPARMATIPAQPWHTTITRSCNGPTIIDITTTITTTISLTVSTITVTSTVSASPTLLPTTSLSTSTTATPISTISGPVTLSTPFAIEVRNAAGGLRKRARQYIYFANNNLAVGDGFTPPAALFQLASNGSLYSISDGTFIGTAKATGLEPVAKFITNPTGSQVWSRDVSDRLTLAAVLNFFIGDNTFLYAAFDGSQTNPSVTIFAVPPPSRISTTTISTGSSATGSSTTFVSSTGSASSTSTDSNTSSASPTAISTTITITSTTDSSSSSSMATTSVSESSSTTTMNTPPIVTDEAYIDTILRNHNVHRLNHTADALVWSPSLAETARKIAGTCVFQHETTTDGGGYGQNIGAGFPANMMGAFVTEGLYNPEINSYTYYGEEPDYNTVGAWGHFSQVVWKSTTAVGCYTYDCSAQGGLEKAPGIPPYFTVCNYSPAGNVVGAFAQNVGQPLGAMSIDGSFGCPSRANCIGA